jgi:hypothetical protein
MVGALVEGFKKRGFWRERKRFFLKKRSKKLLIPAGLITESAKSRSKSKVFCALFFQKSAASFAHKKRSRSSV